ncbi:MAG: response regulator, partial [Chloroflexota bacterium]
ALSVRGAEKMLERYAQKSADGITTFTKRSVILVIDDELALLTVLSNALKRAGYDVYNAANGQRGIEQAQKHRPDLIICDIMMPSPNGFKVREILSEDPITANIPFIFLSARTAKGDIVFALKSGGDDYITKPFDRGELIARVEAVLRRAS